MLPSQGQGATNLAFYAATQMDGRFLGSIILGQGDIAYYYIFYREERLRTDGIIYNIMAYPRRVTSGPSELIPYRSVSR